MRAGPDSCETIGPLLGAYALDALDATEAAAVEAHVAGCLRCTQEVEQHVDTVGLLAASGGDAPAAVWDRIAASIEGQRRPEPNARRPGFLRPTQRGRRWPARVAAALVAAAAITVIVVQTVRINHLNRRVSQIAAAAQQRGAAEGAAAALLDPSATQLVLASTQPGGARLGKLVILPSGRAYLVDVTLSPLPSANTYQMWSVVSGRAVSVALLGNQPHTVPFNVDPGVRATAYLLTIEPAGGVVAPTSAPVAQAAP